MHKKTLSKVNGFRVPSFRHIGCSTCLSFDCSLVKGLVIRSQQVQMRILFVCFDFIWKKNWLEKPRRKWQLKKMDKTTCGCQAILAWQWNMEVAVGTLGTLVILLLLAHVGPPIKRLVKNKNGKINLLSHLHYNGGYFNGIFPQNNARYYICQWLNLTSTSKAAQIIFNFCSKPKTPKVMAKFVMAIF